MSPGRAEVLNQVVATVDGDPITAFELASFIRQSTGADPLRARRERTAGRRSTCWSPDALIRGESQRLGLSASEAEIDAYINQIKQQNHLDDASLQLALQQQGLTLEGYRAQIKKEILKNQLVSRQIRQRVNITPEEVQRYYDEHKDEFGQAGSITVRHIFFALPANANPADAERVLGKVQEAEKRLGAGDDLEAVARDLSEGAEASEGGPWARCTRWQMQPELEQVAFSLKKGEVRQSRCGAGAGVHILKVDDRKGRVRRVFPSTRSRDKIKERLTLRRSSRASSSGWRKT